MTARRKTNNNETRKALLKLKRRDGKIYPEDVVKAARDKGSPLHRYFTWDVQAAARARWLDEARELIRVHVSSGPTEERRYVFVSLMSDRVSGGGYRQLDDVLGSESLTKELMVTLRKDYDAVTERYTALSKACHAQVLREKLSDLEAEGNEPTVMPAAARTT